MGGLSVLWGGLLGGLAERQVPGDLRLELEESVPGPGWGLGQLARAGWRGRPGSVMFESDVSP